MAKNVFRALVFAFLLVIGLQASAYSQCFVVTPTGSGSRTGADWNNSINGGNLTSVVTRGGIYYLAGGAYNFSSGSQTFQTPDSGTQTITIRAATAADQGAGAGCGQAGFVAGMAASGSNQVVFRCSTCISDSFNYQMRFLTDYWILDGNDPTRTTVADTSSAYNMMIDNSWRGGARDGSDLGFHVMLGSSVNTVHDITLKYIEYVGPGLDSLNVDPQAIASIS
jgi:hypothetical protein